MSNVKITIETQTSDVLKAEKLKSALQYMLKEIGEDGLIKLKEKYETNPLTKLTVKQALRIW